MKRVVRNIVGMVLREGDEELEVTGQYEEDGEVWIIVDGDFEVPIGDILEVNDLLTGQSYLKFK